MTSHSAEVGLSSRWPWLVAGAALVVAFGFAVLSPADVVQGDVSRIMYVHVPAAWLAYLAFAVTLIGSVVYLATHKLGWDRVAASSAEVGVFFTGLTIALGMIWGKPVWGVWWTWDARLTLTAIMFFVYLGYLALRRTSNDSRSRASRSAVLGVLAIVMVPLVHFSVVWWRGLHQPPTVLRPDSPQMDTPLLIALLIGVAAFTIVYLVLLTKRVELSRLQDALTTQIRSEAAPIAGDAVSAPNFDWSEA